MKKELNIMSLLYQDFPDQIIDDAYIDLEEKVESGVDIIDALYEVIEKYNLSHTETRIVREIAEINGLW